MLGEFALHGPRQADDRQRGLCGHSFGAAVPNMTCGVARASEAAQGDGAGRISASSCERLHKIGDRTAQFVGFQFEERVDQARAMGGKRHID
jgi:hypothetical protein